MSENYSKINIEKVRQLRPLKIDYTKVHNLEYVNKEKQPPQTFAQYRAIVPPAPISIQEQARPIFSTDLRYLQNYSAINFSKGKMLVIINSALYPQIKGAIDQYIKDVAYEGYFVTVYLVSNGSPAELRNFIIGKQPIAGALMIGNLPVAWFEMADDFHGPAEFPCDLYYMDLNGVWNDPDNDGKFSEHPTNVQPEIWVGRLYTPTSNGNDAALINDYFNRNHKYRKGLLGCINTALAFVDDPWQGFGDCAFDYMFPSANVETITDPAQTNVSRYKGEINQYRAWAQVCSHSNPWLHSFLIPNASTEYVQNTYLRDVNPPNAFFYNLFACSNALFTQSDYMAGWYIFDKSGGSICNGLAAIGSTKSGSMQIFENFYGSMATGKTIGEAYVAWWKALGTTHDLGMRQWYYGLTLLGDPTINWWSGAVPTQIDPPEGDVFDHYPRMMNLRWNPVNLLNVGVSYQVEIDAFHAVVAGQWAAESGKTFLVSGTFSATNYEHMFVGMQRGRWRVRAKVGSVVCPWSDWRYFQFKV